MIITMARYYSRYYKIQNGLINFIQLCSKSLKKALMLYKKPFEYKKIKGIESLPQTQIF